MSPSWEIQTFLIQFLTLAEGSSQRVKQFLLNLAHILLQVSVKLLKQA